MNPFTAQFDATLESTGGTVKRISRQRLRLAPTSRPDVATRPATPQDSGVHFGVHSSVIFPEPA